MSINYTDEVFAKRLADVRGNRKMSQADLAKRVGISKDTIINWEQGRNTPRLDLACALADALGCALDDLVRPFPATLSELKASAARSAAASPRAEVDRFAGAAKHAGVECYTGAVSPFAPAV